MRSLWLITLLLAMNLPAAYSNADRPSAKLAGFRPFRGHWRATEDSPGFPQGKLELEIRPILMGNVVQLRGGLRLPQGGKIDVFLFTAGWNPRQEHVQFNAAEARGMGGGKVTFGRDSFLLDGNGVTFKGEDFHGKGHYQLKDGRLMLKYTETIDGTTSVTETTLERYTPRSPNGKRDK